MAARTKLVQLGTGSTAKVFRASAVMYTSQNADVLGIKDVEEVNLKAPLYDTGELMRVGALVRLNVACQGTGGRKINYRIFCDGEEVSPALAFYRSTRKTLNGRTVLGANLDRRQVLR